MFIHGGGFQTGGGSLTCYNGGMLAARQRAIVVNVTYRIGALGFLGIEGFAPANLGIHDQIAALRFIKAHIASFGADPANITLVGQSAGAYSIAFLMMHPEGPALFSRAVMMTTMLAVGTRSREQAAALEASFLAKLGVDRQDLAQLREVEVSRILEAQAAIMRDEIASMEPDHVPLPYLPTEDGDLVPRDPLAAFAEKAAWCPMIIGATREEYAAFWFDDDHMEEIAGDLLAKHLAHKFGNTAESEGQRLKARRTPRSNKAALIDFHTRTTLIEPMYRAARKHADEGGTSYVYRFDWQSPNPAMGACHCIELPFLFGNFQTWKDAPMIAGAPLEELQGLCDSLQGAVGSFARMGDPTRGLGFEWPAYAAGQQVVFLDRLSQSGSDSSVSIGRA